MAKHVLIWIAERDGAETIGGMGDMPSEDGGVLQIAGAFVGGGVLVDHERAVPIVTIERIRVFEEEAIEERLGDIHPGIGIDRLGGGMAMIWPFDGGHASGQWGDGGDQEGKSGRRRARDGKHMRLGKDGREMCRIWNSHDDYFLFIGRVIRRVNQEGVADQGASRDISGDGLCQGIGGERSTGQGGFHSGIRRYQSGVGRIELGLGDKRSARTTRALGDKRGDVGLQGSDVRGEIGSSGRGSHGNSSQMEEVMSQSGELCKDTRIVVMIMVMHRHGANIWPSRRLHQEKNWPGRISPKCGGLLPGRRIAGAPGLEPASRTSLPEV